MNIKERTCPICSCREKIFLYRQDFGSNTVSPMAGYDIVACERCGFAYADGIPSQTEFDDYYATMSKYEFVQNDGFAPECYTDYFTEVVKFLAPCLKERDAKILDIGCSTGALLSIFKSNGYTNLVGIDPSPSCVKTAKESHGISATVNNISNFSTGDKFDLIILSAVLEHLADFNLLLPKIRLLLKDDGLLFVEVPDVERFALYIFSPFQQFSTEHINYFSRYSAENLLSKFSFKPMVIEQREHKLSLVTDPSLFILAEKADKNDFEIVKDEISEINLKNYTTQCSIVSQELKKVIQEKLTGRDKIIVWGAGTHTLRLVGSGLDTTQILYFVDSNSRYWGEKVNGIIVKPPGDIKEEIPILVSTYSYQEEIIHQIREVLKLKNEIITLYG